MKRLFLLFAVFFSLLFSVYAQEEQSTNPQSIPGSKRNTADSVLMQRNKELSDSISHIRDSFGHLGNIMYGSLVVDKANLDSVIAHPNLIYKTRQNINLVKNWVNWSRFILCLILIIGFFYLGFNYAINGGILKDVAFDAKGKLKEAKFRPYSFARVQLFWWTMIILFCYSLSFAITGVLIPINPTMVILLGCGLLVYAGGNIIDNRQINGANKNIDTNGGSGNTTKMPSRHQDNFNTESFFSDILSDENGISMHRFQSMVFNVMFGVAYLAYFINNMKVHWYPFITFNDWQFAMIGISSAAYLGLKAGENGANTPTNPQGNGGNNENTAPATMPPAPIAPVAPAPIPPAPVAPTPVPPPPVVTAPATDAPAPTDPAASTDTNQPTN